MRFPQQRGSRQALCARPIALGMNYFDYMQSGYVCRDQSANRVRKKQRIEEETLSRLHSYLMCRVASRRVAINILIATTSIRPDAPGFRLAPKQQTMNVTRLELIFGNGHLPGSLSSQPLVTASCIILDELPYFLLLRRSSSSSRNLHVARCGKRWTEPRWLRQRAKSREVTESPTASLFYSAKLLTSVAWRRFIEFSTVRPASHPRLSLIAVARVCVTRCGACKCFPLRTILISLVATVASGRSDVGAKGFSQDCDGLRFRSLPSATSLLSPYSFSISEKEGKKAYVRTYVRTLGEEQ